MSEDEDNDDDDDEDVVPRRVTEKFSDPETKVSSCPYWTVEHSRPLTSPTPSCVNRMPVTGALIRIRWSWQTSSERGVNFRLGSTAESSDNDRDSDTEVRVAATSRLGVTQLRPTCFDTFHVPPVDVLAASMT